MPSSRASSTTGRFCTLLLGLGIAACPGADKMAPPGCSVASISVQPSPTTLAVGEAAALSATLASANCGTPPAVTWSSADVAVVTVQGTGNQVTIVAVAPTASPVAVTATAAGTSGSTLVTVVPRSTIALAPTALAFTAARGASNPDAQGITITNSGGGTLGGLSIGSVVYGAGASDWLQPPQLSGTTANPSATIAVRPITGALPAGLYTATFPVLAFGSTNSPQQVSVSFLVTVPPPAIGLAPATIEMQATEGGANPVAKVVTVTNAGGGVLDGLSLGPIVYGPGASGWLQVPTLNGTLAGPSATFTLQALTGSLVPGVYTATVPVLSAVATNTPQAVRVTLTVTPPPPVIALGPSTLAFFATRGGANPLSQQVTITNGGPGTLSGLSLGAISYGPGGTGWLQAPTLSGTTATPSVTFGVQPLTGNLAVSTYTATIPVLSPTDPGSPRLLTVNFTVHPAGSADPCLFDNAGPIQLAEPVNAALASAGTCHLASGQYARYYLLAVAQSTSVLVDMAASFDTFLRIYDLVPGDLLAEDDDSGEGTNARIAITLQPGNYIIQATSFDPGTSGAYTLSAQAVAIGAPARIELKTGNAQKAMPGATVPIPPAVIVRDANGFGVPGVAVTFATLPGVGSITGAAASTNAAGVATVGSWSLAAGANVLSANPVEGGLLGGPIIFSATGSASPAGFNVDLRFLTVPTLAQLDAFNTAASRWQSIITADLSDIPVNRPANTCATNAPALNETVDDLVILVTLTPIDGPGNVLGSAGPCIIRNTGSLTVVGTMRFDTADLAGMQANGSLRSVILHEMGHVLGIGSLWRQPAFNLLHSPSLPSSPGVDTHFTGVNGIAGFDEIGGMTYTGGAKVPVENSQGGSGTRDSHWRESVLVNELMTGFINAGENPLSILSIRSLADLGYAIDPGAADPFFLTLNLTAEGAQPGTIRLLDDVQNGPIYRIDAQGRVTDLNGRAVPGGGRKR